MPENPNTPTPPNQPAQDALYVLEDPPAERTPTARGLRQRLDATPDRWYRIKRPLSPAFVATLRSQLGPDYEVADQDRGDGLVDVWARFVGQHPR